MATPKILSCLVTLRSYICPRGMETFLWDLGSKLIRSKDVFYPEFLTPFVKFFQFKGQGRQRERNPTHQSSTPSGKAAALSELQLPHLRNGETQDCGED